MYVIFRLLSSLILSNSTLGLKRGKVLETLDPF